MLTSRPDRDRAVAVMPEQPSSTGSFAAMGAFGG